MKIKYITFLFLFTIISCKSSLQKFELINSKANLPIEIINESDIQLESANLNDDLSSDLIIEKLLKNKSVIIDYDKKDLAENLNLENFNDTIVIGYLDVLSPTGGVPLIYSYDVKKGDQVFFNVKNESRNRLKKIEIKESDFTRFIAQDFKKSDSVNSSFTIRDDGPISVEVSNDSKIKNLGFFKSRIKIELKKLSSFRLKKETFYDTISRKRKIVQVQYDTIFKIQDENQIFLGSKRNFSESNNSKFSLRIPIEENVISYTYWLGLQSKDSIPDTEVKDNPLYIYSKNEINRKKTEEGVISLLKSTNDDIKLNFTKHTFDRRGLNFSRNLATFIVDNEFTKELAEKAEIEIINLSTVNDYRINFISCYLSLEPKNVEIEEEYLEIRKKIKLSID